MTTRGQIREALADGPLTQAQIEEKTGLSNLGTPLSHMTNKGFLTKEGARGNCIYTLVDTTSRVSVGKTHGTTGRKSGKKPAKRPAKKYGKRAPKPAPDEAEVRLGDGGFLVAMTHDARLVVIEDGAPLVFSKEQTLKIADSILDVYEK